MYKFFIHSIVFISLLFCSDFLIGMQRAVQFNTATRNKCGACLDIRSSKNTIEMGLTKRSRLLNLYFADLILRERMDNLSKLCTDSITKGFAESSLIKEPKVQEIILNLMCCKSAQGIMFVNKDLYCAVKSLGMKNILKLYKDSITDNSYFLTHYIPVLPFISRYHVVIIDPYHDGFIEGESYDEMNANYFVESFKRGIIDKSAIPRECVLRRKTACRKVQEICGKGTNYMAVKSNKWFSAVLCGDIDVISACIDLKDEFYEFSQWMEIAITYPSDYENSMVHFLIKKLVPFHDVKKSFRLCDQRCQAQLFRHWLYIAQRSENQAAFDLLVNTGLYKGNIKDTWETYFEAGIHNCQFSPENREKLHKACYIRRV